MQKQEKFIIELQDDLDYLLGEWQVINLIFQSARNAFDASDNVTEEHLGDVDRELSIAYNELMAQVRQLDRRLKRTLNKAKQESALLNPTQKCTQSAYPSIPLVESHRMIARKRKRSNSSLV